MEEVKKTIFLNNMNLIEHAKRSIQLAEGKFSKLTKDIFSIYDNRQAMSSHKGRHLFNNLCDFNNCNYLEVGSWRGSVFSSAIFNNQIKACSIDYWPEELSFRETRVAFYNNLSKVLALESGSMAKDIRIINQDCFKTDISIFKNINVYLYDGDHSEESQYKGFTYFNECFDKEFIAIVDDWNSTEVKNGTMKAFKDLNYKIKFKQELIGRYQDWSYNDDFWWNGMVVFVIEKL